jgi:hypothetical protein
MATINASTNEKIVSIRAFLGMHENPDGDNKIKLGEAAVCRNFRITESGNLKKRPGTTLKYRLGTSEVKGMWHGEVNKHEIFVVACAGHLWMLMDNGEMVDEPDSVGEISTTNDVHMFGFDEKMWVLNGENYFVLYYDDTEAEAGSGIPIGWTFQCVTSGTYGYRPLVAIAVPPDGGGTLLEQINKLNGYRRCWISPDGAKKTFYLPDKYATGLMSIDWVHDLSTSPPTPLQEGIDYDINIENGTVTFRWEAAPAAIPNSFEIAWTVRYNYAPTVGAMRYSETYAGTQDSRVFLYGNGTNHAFYSGLDYDGNPRGDYFPDLNQVDVGDANTPITAMIRHYTKLMAYKPNACFSIDYGVVTLADSLLTPAFYATPLNKTIGNVPLGQVQLVLNAPRTLSDGNLFEWRNGAAYSANISMDERQAKRLSDRIFKTLRGMDFTKVHCYDDNHHMEYYIVDDDGNALVHNYMVDAWYYYTGVDARLVLEVNGNVYIGTKSGKVLLLDEEAFSDEGEEIDCKWESGSLDFGAGYMRKYSALMWVGVKSEPNNAVMVTAKTDRSIQNTEVIVDPDYENDLPKVKRCKVKVKKFVYYKLLFSSKSDDTTCTVVDTEIKVRYASQAK